VAHSERIIGQAVTATAALSRGELIASEEPGPFEILHAAEIAAFVRSLKACLGWREMIIIILRYDQDLDWKAIAETLETTPGACLMAHRRALRKLRQAAALQGVVRGNQVL